MIFPWQWCLLNSEDNNYHELPLEIPGDENYQLCGKICGICYIFVLNIVGTPLFWRAVVAPRLSPEGKLLCIVLIIQMIGKAKSP